MRRNLWLGAAALALLGILAASRAGWRSRAPTSPGSDAAPAEREPAPAPPEVPVPEPAPPAAPPEQCIRGIVRDAADLPVAGAQVTAADRYDYAATLVAKARTADDGTFSLGPVEEWVVVVAEHPERGVASCNAQCGDSVELWLHAGATIAGTVRARDGGRPLAGASVHIQGSVVIADAEGRYAARNVVTPLVQVVAVADGYRQARRAFSASSGDVRTLDFTLERGETLTGLVTDARTGMPVAGAEVSERAAGYGIPAARSAADRRVKTDAEGRYVLEGVAAEENRVFFCIADDYIGAARESDGSGKLDFVLERGLAADGQVVDPLGKPVADATVHLHRVAEAGGLVFLGRGRSMETRTDGDGRFRFEGVVPGTAALVAVAKGFAPGESPQRNARDLHDVVVRLGRGMALDVTVRDADGLGVAEASVNTGAPAGLGDRFGPFYGGRERASQRTDEEGRLRLDGMVPGDYILAASHARFGHAYAKASGKEGEVVPVVLEFGRLEITGRVLTAGGEPAADAGVSAFGNNVSESARTDGLGRFRIPGLPEGSFRLWARRGGAASPTTEVAAGTQGVELRLVSQTVRGTVRGAGSGPLASFLVRFLAKGKWNDSCEVEGGDGTFEAELPPGTYDVTAQAPGHTPAKVRVVVEKGTDPAPFELVLEPAATVRGTARGPDGRPLPYAWVTAAPAKPGKGDSAFDKTDHEGRFVLAGLGPGDYALVLDGGSLGTSRTAVSIPAPGDVAVDLRLGPTGTVVVHVADAQGKPLPRAYVTFVYAEHGAFAGEGCLTNEEGTATSGPVPADVALVARAQLDDARSEVEVTVRPGGRAEARITLPKE